MKKIVNWLIKFFLIIVVITCCAGFGMVTIFMKGSDSNNKVTAEYIEVDDSIEFAGPFIDKVFVITSDMGNRPLIGDEHKGIDMDKEYGAKVIALCDALVYRSSTSCSKTGGFLGNWCPFDELAGAGNYVVLVFEYKDKKFYVQYMHMADIMVSTGQKVKKGQVIGTQGSSGNSEGSHLHVEIHYDGLYTGSNINLVNPRTFLNLDPERN